MIRRAAVGLFLFIGLPAAAMTAVCDPPGPPPRFGCWWSTESCDWLCAICDPFGAPPRSSCHWDLQVCNWICPGFTGADVTVRTTAAPTRDATVYVTLSSLCRETGVAARCSGSFAVNAALSVSQKCEALAQAVAGNCAAAGYAVAEDDCAADASFTARNVGCPGTQFALGISNDPSDFDQADQASLPDGESESTQGVCAPMPGPVSNLRLEKANGGSELRLTWDPAPSADTYTAFDDPAAHGSFSDAIGATTSAGVTVPMPAGDSYYLVAGSNATCGSGPKD